MVLILAPSSRMARTEQEFFATPLTVTVQALHSERSQPIFVPVRPSVRRSTSASESCEATFTHSSLPLTLRWTTASETYLPPGAPSDISPRSEERRVGDAG